MLTTLKSELRLDGSLFHPAIILTVRLRRFFHRAVDEGLSSPDRLQQPRGRTDPQHPRRDGVCGSMSAN